MAQKNNALQTSKQHQNLSDKKIVFQCEENLINLSQETRIHLTQVYNKIGLTSQKD